MCFFGPAVGCLSLIPTLFDYQHYAPLFLRLGLAAVFIIHGYPKLFGKPPAGGIAATAGFFESIGIRPGKFWVLVVGVVEFFGGILLVIGLFVQPVAMLIVVNMVVAIWKVKFKQGFVGGYEFDLMLLLMAASLV